MTKNKKMLCPDCGVEMNHHAMKIDYTTALDAPLSVDPDFGGVLEEAHTCPKCGRTHLRRSVDETDSTQN
jgi:ribosomal protein S27AE